MNQIKKLHYKNKLSSNQWNAFVSCLKRNSISLVFNQEQIEISTIKNHEFEVIGLGARIFLFLSNFNILKLLDLKREVEVLNTSIQKKDRKLILCAEKIILESNDNSVSLAITAIKELNYTVEKDQKYSVGSIFCILDNEEVFEMLTFFGKEKRYVEDDTEFITKTIAELL